MYLNKPFTLPLTGGNGTYRLWAYPTDMLDMVVNGTDLVLKLLKIPTSLYPYFSVTDSAGQTLAKRIIPLLNEVVLEKEILEVPLNGTADLNVIDGNGGYVVYKNDENVSVSQVNTTRFSIYGKAIGESVLEVRDSYGKGKTVVVRVVEKSTSQVTFSNLQYQYIPADDFSF